MSIKRNTGKTKPSVIQKILALLSERANLLKRTVISGVLQAITSDISVFYYDGGKRKCYLAVHKDVFGQQVYGWSVSERMETLLVLSSLRRALKNIRALIGQIPKPLLFHQDQGSRYTSF